MEDAQVMLVTGASRGIGKAIARAGAAEKISVVVNYYAAYLLPHRITANAIAPALIIRMILETE